MNLQLEHEIEQLRRSVAMLRPGEQALDRETTLQVLHRLQLVSRRVSRLEGGLQALLDEDDGVARHPSAWIG
ncbi:MAG: hypothetical protein ACR2PK_05725 [Acidimicrobiales bacterium]